MANLDFNVTFVLVDTKDIIKVEVWDVVDKGIQKGELKGPSSSTLKIDNNTGKSQRCTMLLLGFYFFPG